MLLINEATVRRLLPMAKAIELLEEAFGQMAAGLAQSQPRRRMGMSSGAMLHAMAGATPKYFGTKVYSTQTKPAGAWFFFMLYDVSTAKPLALFEANWLGQIRTGGASGVATKLLAREDATKVALLGTGFQGASQLDAALAVRPITEIHLWNRNRPKAEAFGEEYQSRAKVFVHDTADEAVAAADIVASATFASSPLFAPDSARPGTHFNAAGSNHPKRNELPPGLLHRAELTVVDALEQARLEAGDLLLALTESQWGMVKELHHFPRRVSQEGITIFKSVGLGLEDVAVASYIYEQVVLEGKLAANTAQSIPLFETS